MKLIVQTPFDYNKRKFSPPDASSWRVRYLARRTGVSIHRAELIGELAGFPVGGSRNE